MLGRCHQKGCRKDGRWFQLRNLAQDKEVWNLVSETGWS